MVLTSWIGALAALASTISFGPQALKIIRTGETGDISLGMYVITVTAFALWLAYGILLRQWPIVAANGICLLLSGFILVMKALPPRKTRQVSRKIKAEMK
ncbi:MAG: SemiSWEET transporter [Alphaproteobacteria bacterium]|nr:SemiSWEET transporter [Alphaproteobacteria bacterium]